MSTDCEIKTMEADLPLDMNFRGSEVDNKVIIKACAASSAGAQFSLFIYGVD
jgi:hypothetical protein